MRSRTWLVMALACALCGQLAAQPAAQQKKGAKKAAKVEPKVDLAPAVAALGGASNDAAIKAAETLGASGDPAAHEALLDALAFGMPPQVAIAAIGALAMHPAPPDVVSLVRYASHHNPAVRGAALVSLASYPAPAARKALLGGLRDMDAAVRAAAAGAAAKGRLRDAVAPLFELLAREDESAGKALAAMAGVELARKISEQHGKIPEPILATTLGLVLKRADFGPDAARVDVVRALGKIQDPRALAALTEYVDATPKTPPRQSREEAQKMVEARTGGAK